jgi:phenylacetate-CoA ligase
VQGTNGQYLPGSFFAHYLKEFDYAIKRFQVVQEEHGAIAFRIVKGGRFSEDVLEEVLATFRRHLGEKMKIQVEFVDDVALIHTGKRLASVSKLAIDFQKESPAVIGTSEHSMPERSEMRP